MSLPTNEFMMAWVSLVHAGSYLPSALSQHLQDELGISLPEQDLLKQLGAEQDGLKLVELSRRIFLSKAGVTKMMDRLETAGFVARERSTTDRRVINAKLTRAGEQTLQRSRKLLVAWVKTNFADHLDGEQLPALGAALEAVLQGHNRWAGQMTHLEGGGDR